MQIGIEKRNLINSIYVRKSEKERIKDEKYLAEPIFRIILFVLTFKRKASEFG